MIKINETYSINGGQGTIVFSEGKKGTVNASYEIKGKKDTGVINGTLDGNVLNGTYHNKIGNSSGLIQFVFTENGFDCKWKQGLEPGPMRGKWDGKLNSDSNISDLIENKQTGKLFRLDINTGVDELNKIMERLVSESKDARADFTKQLIVFVRENQETLWLIPAYLQVLESLEEQIDDGGLEGELSGFFNKSQFAEEISSRIFSKQSAYYDTRSGLFAWNDEDDKTSLFNLILEDMGITLQDLINSYNSEYKSKEQVNFIKFCNMLRTVLFASIVKAYYTEEYDNESIGYLIVSPLEDENIRKIESETSGFADSLIWAIDDVLYCLNLDVNEEDYDEEWGNYSKNYEKMAEVISDTESYDFPLIKL